MVRGRWGRLPQEFRRSNEAKRHGTMVKEIELGKGSTSFIPGPVSIYRTNTHFGPAKVPPADTRPSVSTILERGPSSSIVP